MTLRDQGSRLYVIARELHELMRLINPGSPSWEDLDMTDPEHAKIIQKALEEAQAFIPSGTREPDPDAPS